MRLPAVGLLAPPVLVGLAPVIPVPVGAWPVAPVSPASRFVYPAKGLRGVRMPRGLFGGRTVGTTRWSHYQPSALLVAGLLFLMFVVFSIVMILGLAGYFR